MKILTILIIFALSILVEANFWAAAIRGIEPVILSAGTIFATVSLDNQQHEDAHFLGKWTGWRTLWNDIVSVAGGEKLIRPTEVEDIGKDTEQKKRPK